MHKCTNAQMLTHPTERAECDAHLQELRCWGEQPSAKEEWIGVEDAGKVVDLVFDKVAHQSLVQHARCKRVPIAYGRGMSEKVKRET